jgi:uncharacterized SAM-binding protein YcdF (DUF218 family)
MTRILRWLGSLVVREDSPSAADMIVVLAGDRLGYRVLKGAELAREGFAPAILVSNCKVLYSHSESELAIEFASRHGYSPDLFIATDWLADSTQEEATNAVAQLRHRGVHSAIIVTSAWHTSRAGRIYRRLAPDLTFYMVGADDPDWHDDDWWMERKGRKTFFLEAAKTVADYLRI